MPVRGWFRPLPLALVAGGAAIVELLTAIYVGLTGPFRVDLGLFVVSATTVYKPLAIGIACFAAAVWLHDYVAPPERRRSLGRASAVVAAVALGAGLVALAAPMLPRGFVLAHDVSAHTTYAYLFDRALWQGQLPVRWIEWVRPGYGQPLFSFYQVGFYYFVSLVHALGLELSIAIKSVTVGLWWMGAGFMFLLWRPLGAPAAVAAAAVFAWSPYLFLDAYVRAAFPEMAAISFVPPMFWTVDRALRTGRPGYHLALAPVIGLIVICHPPTALVALPLAPAYALYLLIAGETTIRRAGLSTGAAGLGVLLAAFYVVPAVMELDHISISRVQSGYFDYRQHFVHPRQWFNYRWGFGASEEGFADDMSLQVSAVQAGAAIAGLALVALAIVGGRWRDALPIVWWLAVFGGALFMMTEWSAFVWGLVPPLSFLQFPWRFFMLVTVAGGALAALAVGAIPGRTTQALVALGLIVTQWYVTRDYMRVTFERTRFEIGIDTQDWPATENAQREAFREPAYDPRERPPGPPSFPSRWAVADGRGAVEVVYEDDAAIGFDVESASGVTLVVNSSYVPGWEVRIDGRETGAEHEASQLQVAVPPGTHRVDVQFTNTPVRTFANTLSLMALAIWGLFVAWTWRPDSTSPRA
jgi:hypothetical protein